MDVLPGLTQEIVIGLFRCFFLLLFLFESSNRNRIIASLSFLCFEVRKLLTTQKTLEHSAHKLCSINISFFMSKAAILFVYVPFQINLTFTFKNF